MIARLIGWSARNLVLILIGTAFAVAAGLYALRTLPLDAIPDLSDVQVIVYTEYPGQAPQVIEDQVTYPLDHGHADRAEVEGRARLLVLRRLVRLRDLRGRHRPLLGAQPRARIPQRGGAAPAGRRHAELGPGRDRRRLGLPVRDRRQGADPGGAALAPGLGGPLRRLAGRGRRRGRRRGRLRQAIQRRRRPQPPARAGHLARQAARGDPGQQRGCGRSNGRALRVRVHGPRSRLPEEHRRH